MTDTTARKAALAGVFDRAAASYDRVDIAFFGPAGAELVDHARLVSGETVLDVGCGRGASLIPAANAVGPNGSVIGIDLAPEMVKHANAEIAALGLTQARAIVGDAESPAFPARTFDVILAGFVIFFLPNPAAAVRAWAQLLRPGGRLVMTVKPEDNPRHAAVQTSIDAALAPFSQPAATTPGGAPHASPLGSREQAARELATAGFADVRFVDVTYPTRFLSPDHYWRWMWSHGARGTLERIPADQLDQARCALSAALTQWADETGNIDYPMPVRFVIGTAATAP